MFNQRGLSEVPVPVSQTPQEGAAIHVHQLLKPGDGQGRVEMGREGMLGRDRLMEAGTWVTDGGDAAGFVCLSMGR